MDRDADWYPQATVCSATMAAAAAQRLYHLRTEQKQYHDGTFLKWAAKPSAKFPFHRDDGVTIFVHPTELNLGVDVLTGKAPEPSAALTEDQPQHDGEKDQQG